jgi:hypothetical protein
MANGYTEQKAFRLVVKLIRAWILAIAWDRNVFHRIGARYPQAVAAAKEWDELQAALEVIESKLPAKPRKSKQAAGQEITYEDVE